MALSSVVWLSLAGLVSGVLAGFLGIGGGTLLVPVLVQLGFEAVGATATSSLAILVTASAGSFQNWRMGYLDIQPVLWLGASAVVTAFLATFVGDRIPDYILLAGFATLLVSNLYLVSLKKRVIRTAQFRQSRTATGPAINPTTARIATGATAGFMAGLFGVGGGVILVPMQILLLGEQIKPAVRNSLGVIVITSVAASLGHAINGNIHVVAGLILGFGGLIGVQVSTRFLPKMSDSTVTQLFRVMLVVLSIYIFWQAWQAYQLVA
ncbi:MAG: sulfite exporter TauE/SafE family protein [Phormidesmis sp.]